MRQDKYEEEFSKAEVYFRSQISDREGKAFEYGTIVVRNGVLISGGSLLSIPALVGLSTQIDVDIYKAAMAGMIFAVCLVLSIFGSYVIHINWSLHVLAWEKYWEDRQEFLDKYFLQGLPYDEFRSPEKTYYAFGISLTFWIPHILAVFYVVLLMVGFSFLYQSFGIER